MPQSGTTQKLDTLGDRLMYRLAYRNFGDHEALVVNHSVTAGTAIGVRWYELRATGGTLSIFQQGTYAPNATYRWMGSIAQDQAGDMGLGFSTSSSTLHPAIAYTGRLAGDALGLMTQGEASIVAGAGSQTSNLTRWGDYSAMAVDPLDDCTFWFTSEYIPANGSFNWKTRIASFKFPGCGAAVASDFSIAASPASLSLVQGASGSSTISTAVTAGSAATVNLAVSGTPAGATATVSPTAVTAGGSSTLTVNAGTAAAGTYALTITGTEGTAIHSASVSLTVTAPATNDFSIAASPASATAVQGASATFGVTTALVSGTAETVTLSASGVPAGASASFSPASVTAGGSSTLTVSTGTAAAGTYPLTIAGAAPSATHSASVSLTVTTAAGLPGAPTLSATRSGRRGVQLSWTVPATNGSPISAYRIYRDLVKLIGDTMLGGTGTALALILAATVLVALIGTTLACLNTGVRITYVMGRDREVPGLLGLLHGKYATPHYGILVLAAISAALGAYGILSADNLLQIILASNVGTFLVYGMTNFLVMIAFWARPERSSLKHILVPALGLLANLALLLTILVMSISAGGSTQTDTLIALGVVAAWIVVGAAWLTLNSRATRTPILVGRGGDRATAAERAVATG